MTTVVIMPGGFHPFHAGHLALYNSARRVFPDAEVYVAATNDTSARPFPFAVKEKLAKLAGVEPGHFVQVKSPFRAEEITSRFDPAKDSLIFVRSQKDEDKPPQAGGTKKDGSPAYLQPLLGAKKIEPFARHAYMAYLPTVEFGPGMTSATEIRSAWPKLDPKRKTALVMSLYPRTQGNPKLAAAVVRMLDTAIGGVAEGRVIPVNFNNRQQQAAALKAQQDREWAEYNKLDLAHEANLKRLAAWWWNNDESPAIEKKLERMGLEIGRDEGYDDGGAFIVASGDENGDTYLSWPAEELENLREGVGKDLAKLGGMSALAMGAGLAGHYADQQHPKVEVGGQQAYLIKNPGWGRVPDTAMILKGKDGKTYKVWSPSRNNRTLYATPVDDVKEGVAEAAPPSWAGGMGGIRPPAGGTTATPPGIRPPSGPAPTVTSQPASTGFVAPHGDAKQEFELFKAGTKPAVIVRSGMINAYQPLLKTGRYPMKQYTSQGEANYVIGQPGEDDRVEKIYQLVSTASKMGEQGNFSAYNNSNYHRWLGTLLGYPRDKVEAFINNYFRNKTDLAQQRVDVKEAGEDFSLVDEFAKIIETCYWGAVKGYDMTDWIADKIMTDWYRAVRASRNPVLKKVYRSIEDAVDAEPEQQQVILGNAIKALRGPDYKPVPPRPLTPEEQAWVNQFFGGFAGALVSQGMRLRSGQAQQPPRDPKKDVDENQGWAATLESKVTPVTPTARAEPTKQQPKQTVYVPEPKKKTPAAVIHVKKDQPKEGVTRGYIQEESDYIEEKWSEKYKRSINCNAPKGFSQRAHCAGRKK